MPAAQQGYVWPRVRGGGPRKCLGAQFAMMAMQLLAATVVQSLSFDVAPGFEPRLDARFTMRPADGMWMMVRR